MSTKCAIFSINDNGMEEFKRKVPLGDRSKTVENFMGKHAQSLESQLQAAAKVIETDADYGELMQDTVVREELTHARFYWVDLIFRTD